MKGLISVEYVSQIRRRSGRHTSEWFDNLCIFGQSSCTRYGVIEVCPVRVVKEDYHVPGDYTNFSTRTFQPLSQRRFVVEELCCGRDWGEGEDVVGRRRWLEQGGAQIHPSLSRQQHLKVLVWFARVQRKYPLKMRKEQQSALNGLLGSGWARYTFRCYEKREFADLHQANSSSRFVKAYYVLKVLLVKHSRVEARLYREDRRMNWKEPSSQTLDSHMSFISCRKWKRHEVTFFKVKTGSKNAKMAFP